MRTRQLCACASLHVETLQESALLADSCRVAANCDRGQSWQCNCATLAGLVTLTVSQPAAVRLAAEPQAAASAQARSVLGHW